MKTFSLVILLSLATLISNGQNLRVDKYPQNYNMNFATLTDSTAIFENGGMVVNVDSTLTISFNSPVRCTKIRIFGQCWVGDYRHVSMLANDNFSSVTSASGEMGYFGIYGNGFNFYDEADAGYNLTAFSLIVVDGQYTIDSIKFTIDKSVTILSQYQLGWDDGYGLGRSDGVSSVDKDSIFNAGYDAGVASIDVEAIYATAFAAGAASINTDSIYNAGVASVNTTAYYNAGYDAGVASIDVEAIYNEGYAAGLAGSNVDTTIIYNNGFTDGYNSVNTELVYADGYNNGFTAGVASVDTVAPFDNGFIAGVASVNTDDFFNNGFTAGVASVDTVAPYNNGFTAGYVAGQNDCQATAINQNELDNVNVYPNPTSDWVNISVDNFDHAELYSAVGVLLETTTSETLSLSAYEIGTYLLRIHTTNGEVGIVRILRN